MAEVSDAVLAVVLPDETTALVCELGRQRPALTPEIERAATRPAAKLGNIIITNVVISKISLLKE